jgi:hypothetical protein
MAAATPRQLASPPSQFIFVYFVRPMIRLIDLIRFFTLWVAAAQRRRFLIAYIDNGPAGCLALTRAS